MSFLPVEITACLDKIINILPTFKTFVNTIFSVTDINKESIFSAHSLCIHTGTIFNLHERLGHASLGKLKHIKGINIKVDFNLYY